MQLGNWSLSPNRISWTALVLNITYDKFYVSYHFCAIGEEGNHGCGGGLMINAFKYIIKNGGIDTEKSYPYRGHVSAILTLKHQNLSCFFKRPLLNYCLSFHQNEKQCRFKKADIGATMSSYVKIKKESESHLQVAVGTVGPISVAIDASHRSFQVRICLLLTYCLSNSTSCCLSNPNWSNSRALIQVYQLAGNQSRWVDIF